jgi:hypothetical protein
LSIAAATIAATLGADAPGAEESSAALLPQALQEISQVRLLRERGHSLTLLTVLT